MSDTATLRELPPVEPVDPPTRFRQSLLNRANGCKRSAYLYAKYGGGGTAVELDFGTAGHLFFERAMSDLIANEEKTLYSAAEGEDPVAAAREVASLTAAMVDEVLREHPELSVPIAHPSHSVDHLREIAYHWAIAQDVDPESVLGLEQLFTLETPCGVTVTGKVDCLMGLDPDVLGVDDQKTSFNVPAQSEFEAFLQIKLYALMALVGTPVDVAADGSWQPRLPVGEGVNMVRGRMVYPRMKPHDGALLSREVFFTRQELLDWQHDLNGMVEDLARRFGIIEDSDRAWRFPAVAGAWCSECPCALECPLPPRLRDHAGTINDPDQAALALASILTVRRDADAMMREVRNWAKRNGSVRVGDFEFAWRETVKHDPVDWDALEAALYEAQTFGSPFAREMFVREKVGQSFSKRKLEPEELQEETADAKQSADERWGESAPF
jgi:hypothetical protein